MLKLIKNNKSYFEFGFENEKIPESGFYEIKLEFQTKISLPDFYTIFESKCDHVISEKNKILLLSYAFDFEKFQNFDMFFSPSFFDGEKSNLYGLIYIKNYNDFWFKIDKNYKDVLPEYSIVCNNLMTIDHEFVFLNDISKFNLPIETFDVKLDYKKENIFYDSIKNTFPWSYYLVSQGYHLLNNVLYNKDLNITYKKEIIEHKNNNRYVLDKGIYKIKLENTICFNKEDIEDIITNINNFDVLYLIILK